MVNWENKTITGKSGTIYHIEPDRISVGRFAEYEILSLMLAFNSDFKTFYTDLTNIHRKLNEIVKLGDAIELSDDIKKLLAGIGNYTENSAPKIIRFCALFCNETDEDRSTFPNEVIKKKYDDWADIPINDFFLLASEVIPYFRDAYRIENKAVYTESEE